MTVVKKQVTIPARVKIEMIEKLALSIKDRMEHGFGLCLDPSNNTIEVANVCVGKECEVYIARVCKSPNQKYIGDYHTHIISKDPDPFLSRVRGAEMTAIDFHSACAHRETLLCIGAEKDNRIRCFSKKDERNCTNDATKFLDIKNKSIENFKNGNISLDEYKKNIIKFYKELDKKIDEYYTTIDLIDKIDI